MFKNLFNKVKNIFSNKKNEEVSAVKETTQNVEVTDKGAIVVSNSDNQIHGRQFRQESGAAVTVIDPRQEKTSIAKSKLAEDCAVAHALYESVKDVEDVVEEAKEIVAAVKKVSGKYSNAEIEVIKEALKGKETFTLVDVEALAKTMGRDVRSLRTKINSLTK